MKSLLQVIKIKGDEREDLKVLATGVAAALASRKVFFFYLSYTSFALFMTSKFETFVASKVSGFRNILLLCDCYAVSVTGYRRVRECPHDSKLKNGKGGTETYG